LKGYDEPEILRSQLSRFGPISADAGHFKNKYSSLFYQRCAVIAGHDERYRHPWKATPTELAEILGYTPKQFNFRIFQRDVLDPVLKDIELHVRRFKVSMDEPERAKEGRGRPVVGLTFRITPVESAKRPQEYEASHLSEDAYKAINSPHSRLEDNERPGNLVVGQAITMTKMQAHDLLRAWESDILKAKANPDDVLPCGVQGVTILYLMRHYGVGEAFLDWAKWTYCVPAPEPIAVAETPTIAPDYADDPLDDLDEPAAAPEPVVVPVDPEPRKKRHQGYAQSEARDLIAYLDGHLPGIPDRQYHMPHATLLGWTDPDVNPWSALAVCIESDGFNVVIRPALRIVRKMEEAAFRQTMRNLAEAVAEWDFKKLYRICNAVMMDEKKGIVPTMKAPPVRQVGRGFSSHEVTEMDVEYGYSSTDHTYEAAGNRLDDRDDEELELSDEIPF
jgi:hypothetical protein